MKKLIVSFTIVLIMILSTGCQSTKPNIETLPIIEPVSYSTEIQESETDKESVPAAETTIEETEPTTIYEEPTTVAPVEETIPETEPPTTEPEPEPTTEEPKPQYTFREFEGKVMYPTATVNVRTLPSVEGEIVCTRHINEEVWVTAQCNETGWYRVTIEGQIFYMSNQYLSDNRTEVKQTPPATTTPRYNTASGFVYYTVAGQWPERAYEEYLWTCLCDRGISWWYPYAIAQIWAESRWNPLSTNGTDSGICQFNEAMFPARAAHHANFPDANIWSAYDSLYVYSFYIRDVLVATNYNVEATWSYYIKGHFNDPHPVYIAACWKWYNALQAQ